jgi:hypothetical protein
MPVIVLVFGFVVVGCTTTDLKSNLAGEYNLIPKIAGKDFEVLGLVSAQTSETVVVTPFRIQTTISGERVTFDLLLQEAKNLYPGVSDIINVRIDKVDKGTTGPFVWLTGYSATVEYFGNALAIRYTAALDEVRDPLSGKSGSLPSGGAGSGFDGVVEKLGKITGLFKK